MRGVLFDLQVLVGGKFQASLRMTNFELWQLAALNLLLADLGDEMISIGSGRSRGLGRVRGEVTSYLLSYVPSIENLAGLAQLVSSQEQQEYSLHDWMPTSPIELPTSTQRGIRQQYDISTDWSQRLEAVLPAFEAFLQWHGGPRGITRETMNALTDERES